MNKKKESRRSYLLRGPPIQCRKVTSIRSLNNNIFADKTIPFQILSSFSSFHVIGNETKKI